MKNNPTQVRVSLGCGYEPPADRVETWSPPSFNGNVGFDEGRDGESRLKHCPGYTTNLPEVIETLRARSHWSKGQLVVFDKSPHENLVAAIEILDSNVSQFERWKMTPVKDGGGSE